MPGQKYFYLVAAGQEVQQGVADRHFSACGGAAVVELHIHSSQEAHVHRISQSDFHNGRIICARFGMTSIPGKRQVLGDGITESQGNAQRGESLQVAIHGSCGRANGATQAKNTKSFFLVGVCIHPFSIVLGADLSGAHTNYQD